MGKGGEKMIKPNNEELKLIEDWLKRQIIYKSTNDCPFVELKANGCNLCLLLFDGLEKTWCPCRFYSIEYVIVKAKMWVINEATG